MHNSLPQGVNLAGIYLLTSFTERKIQKISNLDQHSAHDDMILQICMIIGCCQC